MEIIVPATVASADDVAALLADDIETAALGVEIRGDEVVFWAPMDEYESVLTRTRTTTTRMANDWGISVDPAGITARPSAPESEWRDAWKRHFHVTRITSRLTIVPSWETHEPAHDEYILHLDPGQAFGTGAHASTRLLLRDLDDINAAEINVAHVLDVGTGSGILAIAAAKLWPSCHCVAVDIDDLAVGATRENSERNGVSDRVACSMTPIAKVTGSFDLVMANIQSSVLIDLADDICARVANGGILLLSGLLTEQAHTVASAYLSRPGWTATFDNDTRHAIRMSEYDAEWARVKLFRIS